MDYIPKDILQAALKKKNEKQIFLLGKPFCLKDRVGPTPFDVSGKLNRFGNIIV